MSIDTLTWNAVFAVINLIQSAMLLYAERPIDLLPIEEEMYIRIFRSRKIPLSRHDFKTLARKAMILDYQDGEAYLQQGERVETVALVMAGAIDVYTSFEGDHRFAKLNVTTPWEWVDSPQFLVSINAGDASPKAAVSLVASGPTQLVTWTLEDIRTLCATNQQLMVCILSVIAHDCAIKITRTEEYLLSSETIRSAAAAMLQESDLRRRADSISKLPITAKQRMIGVDHTSLDMGETSATNTPRTSLPHGKSARRLGEPGPSSTAPINNYALSLPLAASTAEKKPKRKRGKPKRLSAQSDTEMDNINPLRATSPPDLDSAFSKATSMEGAASDEPQTGGMKKEKKGRMLHTDEPITIVSGSPVIEDEEGPQDGQSEAQSFSSVSPLPKHSSSSSSSLSSSSSS